VRCLPALLTLYARWKAVEPSIDPEPPVESCDIPAWLPLLAVIPPVGGLALGGAALAAAAPPCCCAGAGRKMWHRPVGIEASTSFM